MDRSIIYPSEQGRSTDILFGQRSALIGLSKLSEALFGTGTFVTGLTVGPNSPAALNVVVQPGQIFMEALVDATAYGILPADPAHSILKQGLLMDALTINCAAPVTVGYSVNYLIEATYQDQDTANVVLPYFNSVNPSIPLSGQNNSGAAQATERQGAIVITAKPGAAATTGSQATPALDTGNVGLAVVTVAYGQTAIVSGNISAYTTPTIPAAGALANSRSAILNKSVAGSSNVTLDPTGESTYPIINLTGALTGSINVVVPNTSGKWVVSNNTTGTFAITVKTAAGTGIVVPQGTAMSLYCDGTNVYDATSAASVTASSDPTFADNSAKSASTNWVRGAMLAIATAAGFYISAASIGYIKFPSWLGSLIIQWGSSSSASNGILVVTLPIAYPNAALAALANTSASVVGAGAWGTALTSNAQITFAASGASAQPFHWLSIGY